MKKRLLHSLLFFVIALAVSADPIGPTQAIKIASPYLKVDVTVDQIKPLRRSATRSVAENDTLAPLYIIDRGENSGLSCMNRPAGYMVYCSHQASYSKGSLRFRLSSMCPRKDLRNHS